MPVLSTPGDRVDGNSSDALTFAPMLRSWPHRHSVIVVIAALLLAYAPLVISGVKPPLLDVVFTMWPSTSWASSVGTNALRPWITPNTMTSYDQRQSTR